MYRGLRFWMYGGLILSIMTGAVAGVELYKFNLTIGEIVHKYEGTDNYRVLLSIDPFFPSVGDVLIILICMAAVFIIFSYPGFVLYEHKNRQYIEHLEKKQKEKDLNIPGNSVE